MKKLKELFNVKNPNLMNFWLYVMPLIALFLVFGGMIVYILAFKGGFSYLLNKIQF